MKIAKGHLAETTFTEVNNTHFARKTYFLGRSTSTIFYVTLAETLLQLVHRHTMHALHAMRYKIG